MKNILIIGCGLLGSSLLRRIQKKKIANKIFIYEKSKKNIRKIKRLKLPGIILKKLEDGVKKSDLIILCTPMSEYKNLILKMNNFLLPKTIITDVGSSKIESSKIIKKFLRKDVNWTQSHPIAGSEVSGPENGKQNLFENKWCVLIKEKNTKKNHVIKLSNFWKKVGSKVVIMSPDRHDKIFSITSHLPHLIAYNLVKSAQDFEKMQKYDLIEEIGRLGLSMAYVPGDARILALKEMRKSQRIVAYRNLIEEILSQGQKLDDESRLAAFDIGGAQLVFENDSDLAEVKELLRHLADSRLNFKYGGGV